MNIHKHAFMYAACAAIVSVVLALALFMAGDVLSPLNYLSYVGYIVVVILGLKNWRENAKGGYMTYGQAMGYSTWVALYYSLIVTVWTFIFFTFIAHDEIISAQMAKMLENMNEAKEKYHLTDEMVEQQMAFGKRFMNIWVMLAGALFGNMLFLTIFNLVISAFMKKDPPPPAPFNPNFPPYNPNDPSKPQNFTTAG